MRKLLIPFFIILTVASCDKKSKVEKEVEEIPVKMEVHRFDKDFYEAKPADLQDLKMEYPFFFRGNEPDSVWTNKMQNPLWREVFTEVEKKFGNFSKQESELEDLFKHLKYYFPRTKTPVTYTIIGQMDYNNKVFYAQDTLILSLELYLGKDHKFYVNDFPDYQRRGFDEKQLLPDVVSAFANTKIPPAENDFLSQMIRAGKELYMKDVLTPETSDEDKINYSPEQLAWSKANEYEIWRNFLENNLLYSTDQKLAQRFLMPAPFSKFYLEIDNESPGRIGEFIGWQIVRSYMENNKTNLQQLLLLDSKQLFEQSRYKPQKSDE
ncbi:gliding motility lipoprotein GldB [Flavobacterium silvaticum]|uniref:Gliding motility lipoprotein GldB n=1 Tax=Flavobacterium silvaticum TaxID=1852020 RepID=A0A972FTX2_9FLAO|nr:gliding motility lipoprotein GldB [Flavobacterium silvaticum]NMH27515.1 gliding motility lipoprotein GldB [Flavobacterium silvaticum]